MKNIKHSQAERRMARMANAGSGGVMLDEMRIHHDPGGGYKPGQIFFANDSRFLETYFSEPMTTYAVGWRDPNNIEQSLNFIAPPVPVGRRFEWKKATNAEEFLSEVLDDVRAIGSDFKRVDYQGTDVTDKTINKGLTYIADLDNVANPNWQNDKTAKLMRRLYRNEFRRGVSALSAGSVNSNVTWDTTQGKNPDQDVRQDLLTATTATGIRANRIMYGDTAFQKRMVSYEAQSGTSTAYASTALITPEQLASRLMVDKVVVSRERYQTGSADASKAEIVSNLVLAFFAEDGVDTEDPSNIKRFVTAFSGEQGGGLVRVYVQQLSSKLVAITVEHYSKIVVTYTGGIRKWTVS